MRLSVASLRRVVKGDLRIEFVRQELTSYGGLELLRRYVRQLGLSARLRTACAAVGGDYGGARLALLIISLFYVGARRLDQLRYLAGDPLITRFCGLARLPTARTVVNWLKQFTQEAPRVTRLDRRSHPGTESRESDQGAFRQGYADSLIPTCPDLRRKPVMGRQGLLRSQSR